MADGQTGIVILGTTSPIARAIACEYAQMGHALVVAARDATENDAIAADLRIRYQATVHALAWDAEDFDSHGAFLDACVEALGDSLQGVVLCSGHMEDQEAGQNDFAVAKRTIDVNFTGSVSILNRFANHFEEKGTGFLAVLGSVAGDRGRMSNYIYGSSKAGLTAYLEGLRNRLHHAGVQVTTIKPGFMDTRMTWGEVPFAAAPEAAARDIVKAIAKKKNTAYVPWFWRYIMLLIRHIPEWQFKKMKM